MIDLHNITVSRSGRKLFENLNFKIAPGENWVIHGANGSGKTTLLEIIAGAIHPLSGEVKYSFIQGDDWEERFHERQEKIHYIPAHAIQTFLNGYQGLFYQQRYYSMGDTHLPKVKDVIGENLNKLKTVDFPPSFDINNLLELELTRLSNGQLKKVLILVNLLKSTPKFLLLDYPFEGLDLESRKDLIHFIDHTAQAFAIQVIMIDHHHELPKIINRRLVLHDFKISKAEDIEPLPGLAGKMDRVTVNQAKRKNTAPVVELKELTIQYGKKKIMENVNWTINKGERWALTGKNGSGKTTLFSLIYADHPMAYSQKVFLFGRRRGSGESIWDIKKRINYLGPEQIHFLNPKGLLITGREYLTGQHNKNEKHLKKLIDFFQAKDFIDHPVRWLSSGQLQIMLLIGFFMWDKELLLLDEPFQFLDPDHIKRVTEYMNTYLDRNVTLVLIAHYEKDILQWTQLKMEL